MEILGNIKQIGEIEQVTPTFRKRALVITTQEQFPQHILVEFTQEKCDILNDYRNGESVNVGINLRGREWVNPQGEAKYFNSIQGWKIKRNLQPQQSYNIPQNTYPTNQQGYGIPQHAHPNFVDHSNQNSEAEDDLPF